MLKGGMGNLMKQARQMQDKMSKIQEEMAGRTVEAAAGGGMVKAKANGVGDLVSVSIEKEVVDPEDVEMLEDLVRAACNEAIKKGRDLAAEEMKKITGGMNIPGLM
ncbi:MAG: YbaB/EbfC family nucleoid-associated protein [Nitrospinota bacterium]|jgi:DNA-binding YbaB/EbfC family protein|nr:YbaB/EbfC family nucleoid-associated protein [Nitrospinota bacterium]